MQIIFNLDSFGPNKSRTKIIFDGNKVFVNGIEVVDLLEIKQIQNLLISLKKIKKPILEKFDTDLIRKIEKQNDVVLYKSNSLNENSTLFSYYSDAIGTHIKYVLKISNHKTPSKYYGTKIDELDISKYGIEYFFLVLRKRTNLKYITVDVNPITNFYNEMHLRIAVNLYIYLRKQTKSRKI